MEMNDSNDVPQCSESKGDILEFTPHNFHQSIAVRFPPQRLPVCQRCKKNYKSRDICRIKCEHTQLPWNTSYVCITLDDSCIGDDGKYIVGRTLIAKTVDQPATQYLVKKQYADLKTLSVCCVNCKKANRTRKFCREVHKHRDLPWTTVYVVLSASKGIELKQGDSLAECKRDPEGDDINSIAPSRTFLSTISTKQNSVQWLEQSAASIKAPLKTDGPHSAATIIQQHPSANVTAPAMQQHSAIAWQNYNQYCLNQMMMMQNQSKHLQMTTIQKTNTKRKRAVESTPENHKSQNKGRKLKEEAKAAIAKAKLQAHAEYSTQVARQQFFNSQMYNMQQHVSNMMQIQMMQQAQLNAAAQHYVETELTKQCQPPKKRGRKKGNLVGEDASDSCSTVEGNIAERDIGDHDENEAEKLPLDDNPEEDGELLDWFDSSFDVK